jgi:putative ABC transport system permease protein
MGVSSRIRSVWRTLARGRRLDEELDSELRDYVDALVERRVRAGQARADAARAVLLEIGGLEQVREQVREVRMGRLLEETGRDIGYAWRGLRRSPAFTTAALITLALGVAANTAIFSVAYALLVQPLPFRDAERLVFVWADQAAEGYPRAPLSGPELRDLDERASQFDGFGGIWATTAALTGENDPEQLRIGLVTSDFFSLLGAEAALGRTFRAEDESEGAPTGILLSGAVWQRRYGSDPALVGSRIDVNGRPTIVVGVMPVGFRLMMPPDAAVPDDLEAWQLLNQRFAEGPRGQRYLRVVGRMRPGVTEARAVEDVARVGREISAQHAFYGAAGRRFETVPLHADAVRDVRLPLLTLAAGVGILLLIACINVGSLLVARAAARARESALKAALGAGAGRLARQYLAESLVLGGMGAGAGVVLAHWALALLLTVTPDSLGRVRLATINVPIATFSVLTVLAWMALLAVAPARQAARQDPTLVLGDVRRHTGGRARSRLRGALTVAQIALSVVLVVAALLLARTLQRIQHIDLGFRDAGVLSFRVALPGARYPNQDAFNAFSRRLQESLGALPGVAMASAISHVPYDHVPNWGGPYLTTEGADPSTAPQADYRAVAPGALDVLGVRLIEGRAFSESDDPRSTPVVMVDERLAHRAWPGESAVGRRLAVDPAVTGTPATWTTVVGVVKHVRHKSPLEETRDQVYFSARQATRNPSVYLVKTADPAALVPAVRDAIRALDPALPIYDVRPLSAYVDDARALRGFTAFLAALFAAASLLLAALGIYGVVAYAVTERQREFGVRLALGGSAAELTRLVVGESASMTTAGLILGFIGAAAGSWWLRTQLVGIAPWDPVALSVAAAVLSLTSLVACMGPVRRAVRTDPASVLREG